ncbi:hypothetical protein M9Y10_037703 [Tritrichomonas musculus]|uniref:ADP-ribosylation factor n=1 Tax=Tritrichomonas musculus TaxID=1915356 RepID=A0ABR2GR79_9EUKA
MGGHLSKQKKARCILYGLDSVGKTTLLYRIKSNESINATPTLGFNVEEIKYNGLDLILWDIGGQSRTRVLWDHFCHNCQAIIYVIDSSDIERLDEVKKQLFDVLKKELLRDSILLIYANKQDLPNALKTDELIDRLELKSISDREWKIQGACSLTGEGLHEGFDWLSQQIQNKFF